MSPRVHALDLPPVCDEAYGLFAAAPGDREPTLVVGFDGSAPSRAAVAYAGRRAGREGRVVVVHATAPRAPWFGAPSYHRTSTGTSRAEPVLGAVAADWLDGASYGLETRAGPPAAVLMEVAREQDAEEIVVGERGCGAKGLGRVAPALLEIADRPVVVIPSTYPPPQAPPQR